MSKTTNRLAAALAGVTLAASALTGAAPAAAAPAPLEATTAVAPVLGMGNGAKAWWCMMGHCGYSYRSDNWGGRYKVKCLNLACTRWRAV